MQGFLTYEGLKDHAAGGGLGLGGARSQSNRKRSEGDKNTNHNDRNSLPSEAHSIQYSWKCDTFPLQWMALAPKPIPSTSTGCSSHSLIEFLKTRSDCAGTASPCSIPTEAGWQRKCLCVVTVIKLNASVFSSQHAKHNPLHETQ